MLKGTLFPSSVEAVDESFASSCVGMTLDIGDPGVKVVSTRTLAGAQYRVE